MLINRFKEEQDRLNYRTAYICSIIANTARDPKKKKKPFTPEDFLSKPKVTGQDMENTAATITTMFDGEDRRGVIE